MMKKNIQTFFFAVKLYIDLDTKDVHRPIRERCIVLYVYAINIYMP